MTISKTKVQANNHSSGNISALVRLYRDGLTRPPTAYPGRRIRTFRPSHVVCFALRPIHLRSLKSYWSEPVPITVVVSNGGRRRCLTGLIAAAKGTDSSRHLGRAAYRLQGSEGRRYHPHAVHRPCQQRAQGRTHTISRMTKMAKPYDAAGRQRLLLQLLRSEANLHRGQHYADEDGGGGYPGRNGQVDACLRDGVSLPWRHTVSPRLPLSRLVSSSFQASFDIHATEGKASRSPP